MPEATTEREALMTGDEYIALLVERQKRFAAEYPPTPGAPAWLAVPPLTHFVKDGDEQLVRPEVLAKPVPQPKRTPAPVDVERLRERRERYAEHLDRAQRALRSAKRMREQASDLGGGLLSFGGSGPQGARRRVQAATGRGLRAYSEAEARIEHWGRRIRAEQKGTADA